MSDALAPLVTSHRAGEPVGVTSVCSAHPLVLAATMQEAAEYEGPILVEATSNQVNQDGGYTGMRPPAFRELVHAAARDAGVAPDRLLLGGDHLGPNPWRARSADEAMAAATELVRDYVVAGFTKLHLDCSMACADDLEPPSDGVVSRRAARLARAAEDAAPNREELSYVIGAEVPVPGGATHAIRELRPTSPAGARATLAAHREAFAQEGLSEVWTRVRALVVQPGVEFDAWTVADYEPERTRELQRVLDDEPGIVFEAHSTDYQTPERLTELVRDHWAILKVGPGLTFALREALYALTDIESELLPPQGQSGLREVLERQMLAHPEHWASYYASLEQSQRIARAYSYSDRVRYYWPDPEIDETVRRLLENLARVSIPLPMLAQRLPLEYARVRAGALPAEPRALVCDHIAAVLRQYRAACEPAAGG